MLDIDKPTWKYIEIKKFHKMCIKFKIGRAEKIDNIANKNLGIEKKNTSPSVVFLPVPRTNN